MKITVITPATNIRHAKKANRSVLNQDSEHEIEHIIVNDGFNPDQFKPLENTARIIHLPHNTGKYNNGNWFGHKIYAYISQLLDTDFLCLLDEDNSFEANHVREVVLKAEKYGIGWSYRKIIDNLNRFVGVDNYESVCSYEKVNYLLVDTSVWCFARKQIPELKYLEGEWGADRKLTQRIVGKFGHKYVLNACTKNATMLYKVVDQNKKARFLRSCNFLIPRQKHLSLKLYRP